MEYSAKSLVIVIGLVIVGVILFSLLGNFGAVGEKLKDIWSLVPKIEFETESLGFGQVPEMEFSEIFDMQPFSVEEVKYIIDENGKLFYYDETAGEKTPVIEQKMQVSIHMIPEIAACIIAKSIRDDFVTYGESDKRPIDDEDLEYRDLAMEWFFHYNKPGQKYDNNIMIKFEKIKFEERGDNNFYTWNDLHKAFQYQIKKNCNEYSTESEWEIYAGPCYTQFLDEACVTHFLRSLKSSQNKQLCDENGFVPINDNIKRIFGNSHAEGKIFGDLEGWCTSKIDKITAWSAPDASHQDEYWITDKGIGQYFPPEQFVNVLGIQNPEYIYILEWDEKNKNYQINFLSYPKIKDSYGYNGYEKASKIADILANGYNENEPRKEKEGKVIPEARIIHQAQFIHNGDPYSVTDFVENFLDKIKLKMPEKRWVFGYATPNEVKVDFNEPKYYPENSDSYLCIDPACTAIPSDSNEHIIYYYAEHSSIYWSELSQCNEKFKDFRNFNVYLARTNPDEIFNANSNFKQGRKYLIKLLMWEHIIRGENVDVGRNLDCGNHKGLLYREPCFFCTNYCNPGVWADHAVFGKEDCWGENADTKTRKHTIYYDHSLIIIDLGKETDQTAPEIIEKCESNKYYTFNGKEWTYEFDCLSECEDEFKCKEECVDSDNNDYFVSGETKSIENGILYLPIQDICLSNSDLSEYYCKNNQRKEISINCPKGCINGACKNEKTKDEICIGNSVYVWLTSENSYKKDKDCEMQCTSEDHTQCSCYSSFDCPETTVCSYTGAEFEYCTNECSKALEVGEHCTEMILWEIGKVASTEYKCGTNMILYRHFCPAGCEILENGKYGNKCKSIDTNAWFPDGTPEGEICYNPLYSETDYAYKPETTVCVSNKLYECKQTELNTYKWIYKGDCISGCNANGIYCD